MAPESPVLGIDIGGTKIAAGLLAWPSGEVLHRVSWPTRPERGGHAVLEDVLGVARELAASARPAAIGLGVCELVDIEGRLASAHTIDWHDLPVLAELSVIAPAVLEADVRAAALAEACFGAGRHLAQFLYVTIGTGISCCLMLHGRPHLGVHGATGTMASGPLPPGGASSRHEATVTLEQLASGPGLLARYHAAHGSAADTHEVLAAAENGCSMAAHVVTTAATVLGAHIAQLVNVLDPAAVVLGGGLGLREGLYREAMVAGIRRHIWSPSLRNLPVVSAATRTDAGWMGAAAHAARRLLAPTVPLIANPEP